MTEKEIQREIDNANDTARMRAVKEFTRRTGKKLQEQCRRLAEEYTKRYTRILKGESPRAFGECNRDEIARILHTDVVVSFDGYDLDTSPHSGKADNWKRVAVATHWDCDACEAWDRLAFVEAYEKFLYTAAFFSKSIGAEHAMRLYLRAWGMVSEARAQDGHRARLSADDAVRTVNLERVATERLWVEMEAAKLPKFMPRKAKARVKAKPAKTRKRKG